MAECQECNGNCLGVIQFFTAARADGPDAPGWAISIGETYGATQYTNISYCPFCGRKLPDGPPESKP